MTELKITLAKELDSHSLAHGDFSTLCSKIVDTFVLPSIDRLEAEGIKTLEGHTRVRPCSPLDARLDDNAGDATRHQAWASGASQKDAQVLDTYVLRWWQLQLFK